MALAGIKVLELAGLAPTPFLGMVLADFGAKVIRVDKIQSFTHDTMGRGKQSISVNLKMDEGKVIVKQLGKQSDVLIEPFRPGTMEKLGLGPKVLLNENPALVYVRLSGFGQTGPYKSKAGHDINYIAASGVLSKLQQQNQKPIPPVNLVADFAGGGLLAAFGVMAALFERQQSGKGQVVDLNMVDGSAYISSFLFTAHQRFFPNPPGYNLLDGAAPFYDTYKTKDGRYVAVGAIEPQFYQTFIKGLNLDHDETFSEQMDFNRWPEMRKKLTEVISSRNLSEFSHLFHDDDSCVMPVLTPKEASENPHNKLNQLFFRDPDGQYIPNPAPKLSRTPPFADQGSQPIIGGHTREVLIESGFTFAEVDHFLSIGAAVDRSKKSRL